MGRQRRDGIRSLGEALSDLIEHLGIKSKVREYEAVTMWESIVGPQIAKVSTATKIQKGILIVKVSNSPWRNELSIRKEEIKSKVNTALGDELVKDIKFV